jgi:hypothetical protein
LGLIQLILVIITVILALGIVITISAVVSSAILGIVGTAIVIGTAGFLCLLTVIISFFICFLFYIRSFRFWPLPLHLHWLNI